MASINIIFPIGVYTEVESYYINLEGRIRKTQTAISKPLNILKD
jgi:NADH dehydrogenase/NADH:ubiquinone oxidoreductase subunit G